MEDLIGFFFSMFMFFIIAAISISIVVWAYRDGEKRGQNGCLVALLIYFAGLPGIIIWLIIRDGLSKNKTSHRKKCPYCAESIQNDATICPHCRNYVDAEVTITTPDEKRVCPACGTICKAHMDFCPQCNASLYG